jgi:hypothetical protein
MLNFAVRRETTGLQRLNITVYVTPVDNSELWGVQFKGI